jgi:hypothetical protein
MEKQSSKLSLLSSQAEIQSLDKAKYLVKQTQENNKELKQKHDQLESEKTNLLKRLKTFENVDSTESK